MDNRLINILADGEFHSGEALGQQLGISRAAVWKQLQQLQDSGLVYESVKGKGYRVEGGFDLLDSDAVRAELSSELSSQITQLDVRFETGSTNDDVMQGYREESNGVSVLLAERQTSGKGRRGRKWVTPLASSIAFTIGRNFDVGAGGLEGLSLVVGLKVVEALQELGAKELGLKWPNDVIWRERKLAGILLELRGDISGLCYTATGIGLNVDFSHHQQLDIDQPWTDLVTVLQNSGVGEKFSRNRVVGVLLEKILPALEQLEKQGFASFRQDWQALDVCCNKQLMLQAGEQVVVGTGVGVNDKGAYGIVTEAGQRFFSGGEISLRVAT